LCGFALEQAEVAVGEVQPGQPQAAAMLRGRQQGCVRLVVEQRGVRQGAGGDDAAHRALNRALAGRGIAHLLGDHCRFAQFDELGEVRL